ncbi:hypothetical protein P5V15_013811 [Pogonomyrmex californicus]
MRIFYLWLLIFPVIHMHAIDKKFIEVHDLNSKKMSSIDQLVPIDLALYAFPTIPTVLLLPNCMKKGYLRDLFNCGKFYRCEYNYGVSITYYCQPGLIFNMLTETYNFSRYVQC